MFLNISSFDFVLVLQKKVFSFKDLEIMKAEETNRMTFRKVN